MHEMFADIIVTDICFPVPVTGTAISRLEDALRENARVEIHPVQRVDDEQRCGDTGTVRSG